MDAKALTELIHGGESDLLELEREWWDFESKAGKAHFAKDVLAMANALSKGESGFIIVGVEDQKSGGGIRGVDKTPPQETVAQILATYTNPVPRIRLEEQELKRQKLSVLEIVWDVSHPYYAARDIDTILSSDVVYIRRAGMVGRLKPAEFERLIRAREDRVGKVGLEVLQVGFVELPPDGSADRVSFRIANVTEEPVTNIYVTIDVIQVHSRAVYRMSALSGLTLGPGQTREAEIQLSNAMYWDETERRFGRSEGKLWSKWFDLRLYVRFRGYDGLLRQVIREVSIW